MYSNHHLYYQADRAKAFSWHLPTTVARAGQSDGPEDLYEQPPGLTGPRWARPSEIVSSVAIAAAVIAGCRVYGFVTPVPRPMRSEAWAARANRYSF